MEGLFENLSGGEIAALLLVWSAAFQLVFTHAQRHGSKHATAWGVAAFGARGVERVFGIFEEEIKRVLCMTGVASISDISRAILFRDETGEVRRL